MSLFAITEHLEQLSGFSESHVFDVIVSQRLLIVEGCVLRP
jgi:hypothetical protein